MSTEGTSDTSMVAWEPWIQTASGIQFHFYGGNLDEVDAKDIATALSRQPRWAGHTSAFYSVAQHCVCVKRWVAEKGGDKAEQLHALLHDATEAYMCDLPSPLKRLIPKFREIEGVVWEKISKRFFNEVRDMTPLIHEGDLTMLVTEARDLFDFVPVDNWVSKCQEKPHPDRLIPVSTERAYEMYLAELETLTN